MGERAMPAYDISFAGRRGRRLEVVAAEAGIWEFRFRCGHRAVAPGGGLKLYCEVPRIWLALGLQQDDPHGMSYVAVSGDVACVLEPLPRDWKELAWATIRLPQGLQPGQEIRVRYGTEAHPCYALARTYSRAPISWRVDHDATGEYYRYWPPLVISVVCDAAAQLNAVLPTVLRPGETLRCRCRVEDRNCNIGAAYDEPVQADLIDAAGQRVPGSTRCFRFPSCGTYEFTDLQPPDSGIYRLRLRAPGLREGLSNACRVNAEAPRVAWGDGHCHTMWADGSGSVEENFRFARDYSFLDVFSVSEHLNNNEAFDTFPQYKQGTDYSLLGQEIAETTARYHEPDRFVTILAAEYSPSFATSEPKGDFCIFSRSDDFTDMPMARECPDMLALAKREGCVCIPHVGGHILPWEHFPLDTEVVPLLEIAAMHGRFECFAQEALQSGYKLGFVGMSDGHFGRPGYDNWSQHGRTPAVRHRNYSAIGGLTGFLVDTVSRDAVFEAMRARRTIATSGARIAVALDADGHAMGSEYTTAAAPRMTIAVNGTGPLDQVEIIRGDRRALRHTCDGACDVELDWTDPAPLRGETWYYVRVTQRDNGIAWTSPVWVTCTAPAAIDPAANDLPAWDAPPHWPPTDPQSVDPAHTSRLADIFAKRGLSERFRQIEARGLFDEQRGRYACFRARDAERGDKVVRIHLYVDFPDDRLYIVDGESEYGQYYKWE